MRDPRVPQAKKLVKAMIAKKDLNFVKIMITENNSVVAVVRDTVIYTTSLNNVEPMPPIFFNGCWDLEEDEYIPLDFYTSLGMSNYRKSYIDNINDSCLLVRKTGLLDDPEFNRLLALKSGDGMQFYKILDYININKCYFIPIFTGLPNLNKNDTIDISIYKYLETPNHEVVSLDIYKKKINRYMSIRYRIIDLQR